jgi:hypothetical protein
MEHSGIPVDNLQDRRIFIVKHYHFYIAKPPNNDKCSYPNKHSKPVINTVKPISKIIGDTPWWIQVISYLDD